MVVKCPCFPHFSAFVISSATQRLKIGVGGVQQLHEHLSLAVRPVFLHIIDPTGSGHSSSAKLLLLSG